MRPTLDDLRNVEWAPSYMWDVTFPDSKLPAPFDKWFPASSYNLYNMHLDSMQIKLAHTTFTIPQRGGPKTIALTFFDNDDYVLHDWLEAWFNKTILNQGQSVATLSEAVKTMMYVPLKRSGKLEDSSRGSHTHAATLSLYPAGSVMLAGNSAPGTIELQCEFHIVKIVPDSANPAVPA